MTQRRRVLPVVVAVLVAVGIGAILKATDALPEAQLAAVDTLFDLRGTQEPPADVVVVGIDEQTLSADPDAQVPLNRRRHARVIERLTEAGAGVIAYDVQFTEQSAFPDADNALVEAVRASPKVVLATTEVASDGSTAIFGGGEGLEYSRATPAHTRRAGRRGRRAAAVPGRDARARVVPVRGRPPAHGARRRSSTASRR